MSCCKRVPGGVCEHDREERRARFRLAEARILYDMKRPGITDWEVKELEKKLQNLPSPERCHYCQNCKYVLDENEVHEKIYDGAFGESAYYSCRKN
jgi:hypothetical protein